MASKNKFIALRVEPELYRDLLNASDLYGMNMSDYIRKCIAYCLDNDIFVKQNSKKSDNKSYK